MSKFSKFLAGAVCALAVLPAAAQDFNAAPNYGTLNLEAGFANDPRVIAVRSGGELNAANLSSSCAGFISNAPDVRLNYTAGSLPLIISVDASADTTLVVNGPDGSWYCDDDGGERGLNPSLRFNSPQSGRYEIWIGTYGSASLEPGQLHISELESR
ncbi:peptidase S1 [Sphingosinicella terrae]|uniref:peptidase S1 n=1 Tax=Sphingosinicella terrae TaxID=2172047 RepID=UPI000E0D25DA|nr:peptidase S1 [Sphingosinicella terrae]